MPISTIVSYFGFGINLLFLILDIFVPDLFDLFIYCRLATRVYCTFRVKKRDSLFSFLIWRKVGAANGILSGLQDKGCLVRESPV
jgi:hypothetical protein